MADLFDTGARPDPAAAAPRPLADALRPASLAEVVGQDHLLGPEAPIGRMVAVGQVSSLILWGPPGTGKTTIARLLAQAAGLRFAAISAISSGVADLRKVFDEARLHRRNGQVTLLFADEIHRFNKAQQDTFLPVVEDGTIVLVGATTENPSFELNAALLSRCFVFVLNRLDETALGRLLDRAAAHLGRPLPLTEEARASVIELAGGDGRYLLGMVEQALAAAGDGVLDPAALARILQRRMVGHDKAGDGHYDLLSAFHKALRGSDADAALYYAARIMEAGEVADVVFRRLACAASEDVGLADPQAMVQVVAAWQAFERVGWPEGRLFLGQAVAYVATAPKSNAQHRAFDAALELARKTGHLRPPMNILNAPTQMMKDLGYNAGYQYDHDHPDAFSGQEFFPEPLAGTEAARLYRPEERGFEREVKKRMAWWAGLRARRRE